MRLTDREQIKQAMQNYVILGFIEPEKWTEISEDYVAAYNKIKDEDLDFYDSSIEQAKGQYGRRHEGAAWTIDHELPDAPQKPGYFARFLNWAFGYKTQAMRTYEEQVDRNKQTVMQKVEKAKTLRIDSGLQKADAGASVEQEKDNKQAENQHNEPENDNQAMYRRKNEMSKQIAQLKQDLLRDYQENAKKYNIGDPTSLKEAYNFVVRFAHLQMKHTLSCARTGFTQEQVDAAKEESEAIKDATPDKIDKFFENNNSLKVFVETQLSQDKITTMSVEDYTKLFAQSCPEGLFTEATMKELTQKEAQKEVEISVSMSNKVNQENVIQGNNEVKNERLENQQKYNEKLKELESKRIDAVKQLKHLKGLTKEGFDSEMTQLHSTMISIKVSINNNYNNAILKLGEQTNPITDQEVQESVDTGKPLRKVLPPEKYSEEVTKLDRQKEETETKLSEDYNKQLNENAKNFRAERDYIFNTYLKDQQFDSPEAKDKAIEAQINKMVNTIEKDLGRIEMQQNLFAKGQELNVSYTDKILDLAGKVDQAENEQKKSLEDEVIDINAL